MLCFRYNTLRLLCAVSSTFGILHAILAICPPPFGLRSHAFLHLNSSHNSSFVKAELARKKQEYDASLKARISASVANADVADSIPPLDSLPYVPYLDETGKINDCGADAKVKASVYALYDESETVRYIGVSRSVAQSLRLHLARMPEQTYGFRVYHISKPTRVLLEITRDTWVDQLGYQPQVCACLSRFLSLLCGW